MTYEVKDGKLIVEMDAPHPQVLPFYPTYDITQKSALAVEDYRKVDNCCGHTQRSWLTYYCLKALVESGGGIGVDLGSGGVAMPGCISLDIVGNGEAPHYGGIMRGVHIKADAADLRMLQSDAFSIVIGNHIVEHVPCTTLTPRATVEQRIRCQCTGDEVGYVIRNHWLRILRPGGMLCLVTPDDTPARAVGSSAFFYDPDHKHAWTAAEFHDHVLQKLMDVAEIVEFDTFQNNFSFNVCLRKR